MYENYVGKTKKDKTNLKVFGKPKKSPMGDTVKQTQVSLYVFVQLFHVSKASFQIMLNSGTDFQHKHFTTDLAFCL